MSIAQAVPAVTHGSSRWLLLGSLALNLFFVGVAMAMAVRAPAPSYWDPQRVRARRTTGRDAAASRRRHPARRNQRQPRGHRRCADNIPFARQHIHDVLRQEPFDVEAMRAATAQTRAARLTFDQTIQGVFADIAAKISPAGRQALANWPPGRKPVSDKR